MPLEADHEEPKSDPAGALSPRWAQGFPRVAEWLARARERWSQDWGCDRADDWIAQAIDANARDKKDLSEKRRAAERAEVGNQFAKTREKIAGAIRAVGQSPGLAFGVEKPAFDAVGAPMAMSAGGAGDSAANAIASSIDTPSAGPTPAHVSAQPIGTFGAPFYFPMTPPRPQEPAPTGGASEDALRAALFFSAARALVQTRASDDDFLLLETAKAAQASNSLAFEFHASRAQERFEQGLSDLASYKIHDARISSWRIVQETWPKQWRIPALAALTELAGPRAIALAARKGRFCIAICPRDFSALLPSVPEAARRDFVWSDHFAPAAVAVSDAVAVPPPIAAPAPIFAEDSAFRADSEQEEVALPLGLAGAAAAPRERAADGQAAHGPAELELGEEKESQASRLASCRGLSMVVASIQKARNQDGEDAPLLINRLAPGGESHPWLAQIGVLARLLQVASEAAQIGKAVNEQTASLSEGRDGSPEGSEPLCPRKKPSWL